MGIVKKLRASYISVFKAFIHYIIKGISPLFYPLRGTWFDKHKVEAVVLLGIVLYMLDVFLTKALPFEASILLRAFSGMAIGFTWGKFFAYKNEAKFYRDAFNDALVEIKHLRLRENATKE